jgi:hypothetical protein
MTILFLDFDGVLHPDPCWKDEQHFRSLPVLEDILRDFAKIDIVVSSTWRHRRSLAHLQSLFSPDIAARVIDVTPNRADFPDIAESVGPTYLREIEIKAWLRHSNAPWRDWVALDDKAHWFRPFCTHLVLCNPSIGLDNQVELKLRSKLTALSSS